MIPQVITEVSTDQYLLIDNSSNRQRDAVRISVENFINSIGSIIDDSFLPLAGGTMVGPIVMDATQNAYIHNAVDSEIRTQWTEDVLELMAGFGDTLFTMTKSTKTINAVSDILNTVTGTFEINSTTGYFQITSDNGAFLESAFYIDTLGLEMNFSSNYVRVKQDKVDLYHVDEIVLNAPKLTGESLPTFADNAAAITGGLAVKNIYKTASGELRIVV